MDRSSKIELVKEISSRISSSNLLLLIKNGGISVRQVNNLKKTLRSANENCFFVKNSLLKISTTGTFFEKINSKISGSSVIIPIQNEDFMSSLKSIVQFCDNSASKLSILAAISKEISLIDSDDVKKLARLPSLQVMRSMFLSLLSSSASSLLRALDAKVKKSSISVEESENISNS